MSHKTSFLCTKKRDVTCQIFHVCSVTQSWNLFPSTPREHCVQKNMFLSLVIAKGWNFNYFALFYCLILIYDILSTLFKINKIIKYCLSLLCRLDMKRLVLGIFPIEVKILTEQLGMPDRDSIDSTCRSTSSTHINEWLTNFLNFNWFTCVNNKTRERKSSYF